MVEDEPFWHDDEHDDLLAEEEANRSRRRAFIGVVTASIIGAGALVGATMFAKNYGSNSDSELPASVASSQCGCWVSNSAASA